MDLRLGERNADVSGISNLVAMQKDQCVGGLLDGTHLHQRHLFVLLKELESNNCSILSKKTTDLFFGDVQGEVGDVEHVYGVDQVGGVFAVGVLLGKSVIILFFWKKKIYLYIHTRT